MFPIHIHSIGATLLFQSTFACAASVGVGRRYCTHRRRWPGWRAAAHESECRPWLHGHRTETVTGHL